MYLDLYLCFSCISFPPFLCMFTCLYSVFVTSCDPQLFMFNLCSIYQFTTALYVAALFFYYSYFCCMSVGISLPAKAN